jgi:surface protein
MMFQSCCKLTSVDLSAFDLAKVTDVSYMFWGCSSLESVTFPESTTPELKNIFRMFNECSNLKAVDLSHFDMTNVSNMSEAFEKCASLEIIKINGFGTCKSVSVSSTFSDTIWGQTSEEGLQSLRDTLVTNSFDRAGASYSSLTVTLPSATKARLTDDELAQITAKGYTIA